MNPFKSMSNLISQTNQQSNESGSFGGMFDKMQAMMKEAEQTNPQMFAKYKEIVNGKNPQELQKVAMNLAKENGVDMGQFMQKLGIK